jgi:hypothetical protein
LEIEWAHIADADAQAERRRLDAEEARASF